jgi:hypothetical protein
MNEFIAEELYPFPQDLKFQEREIGGNLYLVAPVYEAVIASTKSGKLQIEPFQISMLFSLRGQGTRGRSPFDDDPFFSSLSPLALMGGNSVQVIAQSPSLTLDVQPVPQTGRPSDFAGAVGEFTVKAEVDKKSAKAYDDLVGLDVIIEGQGNTESLSPPKLPEMSNFTVLGDPEQQVSGRKDGDDYISVKKFSYTLRPTQAGNQAIPPIELSYFDPKKKEFIEASSNAIPMEIAPGSRPVPATPDEESAPEEQDLRYISTETLSAPKPPMGIFSGTTGVVLFLLPPALLTMAGLVSWNRNRIQHRRIDPNKAAGVASSHHLKEAKHALDGGDTKRMAAELATGTRLHFASRFGISEGEATIPEIEDQLARRGASPEVINKITGILEACDSAQFSPRAASETNAREMYNEAVQLLKVSESSL